MALLIIQQMESHAKSRWFPPHIPNALSTPLVVRPARDCPEWNKMGDQAGSSSQKKDLYQITKAIPKVVEAVAQDTTLTLSQRLHLIDRIDLIRNIADNFNQDIDSDLCVSVLRILLLICTLGIFDYRESLRFKLEVALTALFPEKTDWDKTARELTVDDYYLFAKEGILLRLISPARTDELLALLKLPEQNELCHLLISDGINAQEIILRGQDSILAILEERKQNAPPLGPKPEPKKDPAATSPAPRAVLQDPAATSPAPRTVVQDPAATSPIALPPEQFCKIPLPHRLPSKQF